MRTQGKITHWNTEKGYGFITPSACAGEPPPKKIRRGRRSGSSRNVFALVVIVALVAAVAYSRYQKSQPGPYLPVKMTVPASPQYQCDGRTRCSQMHSCAEARFFLQNCPNTRMDGDHDGVPCESQWCN